MVALGQPATIGAAVYVPDPAYGTLRQHFPAAPTVACAVCSRRTTTMSRLADASQRRTG